MVNGSRPSYLQNGGRFRLTCRFLGQNALLLSAKNLELSNWVARTVSEKKGNPMINIIAFREKKTIVSHISEEMTIAMCAMVGPLQCVSTASECAVVVQDNTTAAAQTAPVGLGDPSDGRVFWSHGELVGIYTVANKKI